MTNTYTRFAQQSQLLATTLPEGCSWSADFPKGRIGFGDLKAGQTLLSAWSEIATQGLGEPLFVSLGDARHVEEGGFGFIFDADTGWEAISRVEVRA